MIGLIKLSELTRLGGLHHAHWLSRPAGCSILEAQCHPIDINRMLKLEDAVAERDQGLFASSCVSAHL